MNPYDSPNIENLENVINSLLEYKKNADELLGIYERISAEQSKEIDRLMALVNEENQHE